MSKNYLQYIFISFIIVIVCVNGQGLEQCISDGKDLKATINYCRYRNLIYPRDLFREITGYWCYSYGDITRFKNKSPLPAANHRCLYNNITYGLPYSNYTLGQEVRKLFYNYVNENYTKYIAASFAEDNFYNKWYHCAEAAEQCCKDSMTNENIISDGEYCPVTWDAWDCFQQTKKDIIAENACPSYIYMNDPPCVQSSEKQCFSNGTWNETTNYETCQFLSIIRSRHNYHIYALYVSIAVCLPAIIIFYSYRPLRITRVILHRNLLIAIVIKNIFVIMSKVLLTLDAMDSREADSVLVQNSVACRVLAFFERVAINAMYSCMLVDGFYLHKIIVTVFRQDPPIYLLYSVVAIFALVPILIWSGFKASQANVYCWIVDDSWRQWIIDGSRYLILAINLVLLLDIIRVLIWKLKKNSRSKHTKATLRATLILLPLFGINIIIMSQRPKNAPCLWDSIFYYVSYTMDSLQGILVALLYCYFNKEVQTLMKKSFFKVTNRLFGGDMKIRRRNRRSTLNQRRTTTATFVPEHRKTDKISPVKSPELTISDKDSNISETKVQDWLQNNENMNS